MSFFKKTTTGRFAEENEYELPPAQITAAEPKELDDFKATEPPAQKASFGGVNLGASSIELKVVRPERYEEVAHIADHLMSHRTVVLNLEGTNKENQRRMIDFLSGVAYAIDGQIKRVATETYIITPCNVDVSDGEPEDDAPVESAPVESGEGDFISEFED